MNISQIKIGDRYVYTNDGSIWHGKKCIVTKIETGTCRPEIAVKFDNGDSWKLHGAFHRLQPIPPQPSWSDAPTGWNWIAQDKFGEWFAYGDKPHVEDIIWKSGPCDYLRLSSGNPTNPNWKDTLEKRPPKGFFYIKPKVYTHTLAIPGFAKTWEDSIMKSFIEATLKGLEMNLTNTTNMCPITRDLEPKERINAKRKRLEDEIAVLDKRIKGLDDIVLSVNWTKATAEIKNKAVQAADSV